MKLIRKQTNSYSAFAIPLEPTDGYHRMLRREA
jgi:hypothetical protein